MRGCTWGFGSEGGTVRSERANVGNDVAIAAEKRRCGPVDFAGRAVRQLQLKDDAPAFFAVMTLSGDLLETFAIRSTDG